MAASGVSTKVKYRILLLLVLVSCLCLGVFITHVNKQINKLEGMRKDLNGKINRVMATERLIGEFRQEVPELLERNRRTLFNNINRSNEENNQTDISQSQEDTRSVGGAVYTRWGRTDCDATAELVYDGIVGGGWYDNTGSASNPLCLVREPKWNRYDDASNNAAWIYGTEYRAPLGHFTLENPSKFHAANMPCAVCRTAIRSTVIMVPGRNDCFKGWTLEYQGYLMAGHYTHKMASEYICVDEAPEATEAGFRDELGSTFYIVEASCGSLPCPEYVHGREVTCAVCSK